MGIGTRTRRKHDCFEQRVVTGNSGSSPEWAMEINSLSVKESTWQHSRKCEGKTFIACIVEK
jgi:hypothetical protein